MLHLADKRLISKPIETLKYSKFEIKAGINWHSRMRIQLVKKWLNTEQPDKSLYSQPIKAIIFTPRDTIKIGLIAIGPT